MAVNVYTLMNKNTPVLSFSCRRNAYNDVFCDVIKQHSPLLPYGFVDVKQWLENRRAPRNRKHIKELLTRYGCNDIEGFVKFTYCAGLNDTFWVKPASSHLDWDSISLYRNTFNEAIARMAFDGGNEVDKFSSATPELVTDGNFAKCWKRYGTTIYLLKQGSEGALVAGNEPYCEAYAYQLAKEICSNPVFYDVIKHHGKIAARCELFTSEDISYAPYAYIMRGQETFSQILEYFDSIGSGEEFRQMIVLDALTLNTDRHLKNFGVLYNADSMEIKGMAPVFDNNLSLCPFATISELRNLDEYMPTRFSAFDYGFNELAIQCMTSGIKNALLNLQGFRFAPDFQYNFSEERLSLLSDMVDLQIDNLLHEKVISVMIPPRAALGFDNMTITLSKDDMPDDEFIKALTSENFSVKDFEIKFDDKTAVIKNCKASSVSYSNNIEIEIYSADISGIEDISVVSDKQPSAINLEFLYDSDSNIKQAVISAPASFQISQGENVCIFDTNVSIDVVSQKRILTHSDLFAHNGSLLDVMDKTLQSSASHSSSKTGRDNQSR